MRSCDSITLGLVQVSRDVEVRQCESRHSRNRLFALALSQPQKQAEHFKTVWTWHSHSIYLQIPFTHTDNKQAVEQISTTQTEAFVPLICRLDNNNVLKLGYQYTTIPNRPNNVVVQFVTKQLMEQSACTEAYQSIFSLVLPTQYTKAPQNGGEGRGGGNKSLEQSPDYAQLGIGQRIYTQTARHPLLMCSTLTTVQCLPKGKSPKRPCLDQ